MFNLARVTGGGSRGTSGYVALRRGMSRQGAAMRREG